MLKRSRLYLVFVAALVGLMMYQSKMGVIRPLGSLATPINYLDLAADSFHSNVRDKIRQISIQERDLELYRLEVADLKLKLAAMQETMQENKRLRAMLELKESFYGYVVTARVIGRGTDKWSNTFTIDKGSNSEVMKDMAVITPDGLIGKVMESRGDFATVLLIDDPKFSVAVRLEELRNEAILSGAGRLRGVLKYAELDRDVPIGEAVVTSGLDFLFPKGIVVGYISQVAEKSEGLFRHVEVTTFVDTSKTEEVIVVRR